MSCFHFFGGDEEEEEGWEGREGRGWWWNERTYLCKREERGRVVCGGLDEDECGCKEGSKVCIGGAEFAFESVEFVERTSSQAEGDRPVARPVVKEEVDCLVCDSLSREPCRPKDRDRRFHR